MKRIYPEAVKPGDKIAILSPASIINPDYVAGAVKALTDEGYRPVVMPHTLGKSGNYSGTVAERIEDFRAAWLDPEVKAILCSRGGYGCVHLLESLAELPIAETPKWLIGFSDVSALHALMSLKGVVSIHGSMAKALALYPRDYQPNKQMLAYLRGERPKIRFAGHAANHVGTANGRLMGGNLAVLQALMRTPYDVFQPGSILVIEDIAEPIYKVERILMQLRLAGILHRFAGIIVGEFTEYRPDDNYHTMDEMIAEQLSDIDIPVAFHAPIGHIDENMPLLHGAEATLEVASEGGEVSISWS